MRVRTLLAVLALPLSALLVLRSPSPAAPQAVSASPPGAVVGAFLRFEGETTYYRVQDVAGSWILVLERDPESFKAVTQRELYDAPVIWVNLNEIRSYEIWVDR